ncbi:MAG: aspartate kinase [Myxococcales bacterium]|nr:aspartate kinase [Myxococcales bacterium]
MAVKVCKFGGTSVAGGAQLRQVQAIVEADSARRWVVPSAPGKRSRDDQKVTDLLYLCHEHVKRGVGFEEVFGLIRERYQTIVCDLGLSLDIASLLDEVHARIAAGAGAAYCASRGEFLNGHIVAALLGWPFIDPVEIIVFDERGRFLPEETHQAVSARLGKLPHGVISGFYGARLDGEVATFSRGGSDVTGAIIARGVDADVYENWTDVSGLLMADPRIVDSPKQIAVLTYRELRELAYMGATVLHDEAIFPVRESGIPVNIRNTSEPGDPGTMIVRGNGETELASSERITGVAGRKGFSIIAVEKTLMNAEIGFGRRLLGVLESHGISFEHMPSGIDTLSIVVSSSQLEGKADAVLEDLRAQCKPDSIDIKPGIALIATVGRGMMYAPGMAARVMTALADAGINIRMIDQGSGELNIIVGVREDDFEAAVRAIYQRFVK